MLSSMAATLLASAIFAGFGLEFALMGELLQGIEVGVNDQDDVPAMAAIAPVRPPAGDILFSAEVDNAIAARAGSHRYGGFIKVHRPNYNRRICTELALQKD